MNILTQTIIAGNELWRVLLLFGAVLLMLAAGRIARYFLSVSAARAEKDVAATVTAALLRALARSTGIVAFAAGFKAGTTFLNLTEHTARVVDPATSILFVCALAFTAYCLVDMVNVWLAAAAARTASKLDDMLVPLVRKSLRITIVVLAVLQVATILSDKPVTSLLAGIGLGSLAVALAAQETIKNFFGSMVIFADKPFEMGERIVVDGYDGMVEEVGFRSTRIRTLDGHLVVFPNGELANKSIRNIGRRFYIRRLANITITYDTPPAKVAEALAIIKELLHNHEGMHPDFPPRVYFNEFNSDALNILALYWYHPPNYWDYLAFSEKFNLELLRRFNAAGIEFAFPTQTVYLAGGTQPAAGAPAPSARNVQL